MLMFSIFSPVTLLLIVDQGPCESPFLQTVSSALPVSASPRTLNQRHKVRVLLWQHLTSRYQCMFEISMTTRWITQILNCLKHLQMARHSSLGFLGVHSTLNGSGRGHSCSRIPQSGHYAGMSQTSSLTTLHLSWAENGHHGLGFSFVPCNHWVVSLEVLHMGGGFPEDFWGLPQPLCPDATGRSSSQGHPLWGWTSFKRRRNLTPRIYGKSHVHV